MSYSFTVRAATKADALAAIGPKFDEVVSAQPVHAADREVAIATAAAIIGLVEEPAEGQELSVSVHGWLQWTYGSTDADTPPTEFTGASVGVSVSALVKTE